MNSKNIHEKSLNSLLDKFAESVAHAEFRDLGWKDSAMVGTIRARIQVEMSTLVRMAKNSQRDYDNNPTEDTERLNNHWYL